MAIEATTRQSRDQAGEQRLRALRDAMQGTGIELLLVAGTGRHHFIGANFCWWASGVRQLGRDALVAVPADGEPLLLTSPAWDAARVRGQSWIADVVAVDDVPGALAGIARERGWSAVRAAFTGRDLASPALLAALGDCFQDEPSAADELVQEVAAGHDELELASIERAVAIAEAGFRHLCQVARPGIPEFELAGEAEARMRSLGADDNFLLISASQHNRAVHAPTDRELWPGDVILGEISPSVDGQFAQICRAAVLGEASERQLACYAVLQEGFQAGLDRAGPGVPTSEVARAVNEVVTRHGYGKYTRPPYMRTRGHAMGLGALLPADVTDSSELVLQTGMAFVLHPNQYFPEVGYLLCGDEVVITGDGARALSSSPLVLESIEVPA
jgi:Xaa-Pro aminopeptidase